MCSRFEAKLHARHLLFRMFSKSVNHSSFQSKVLSYTSVLFNVVGWHLPTAYQYYHKSIYTDELISGKLSMELLIHALLKPKLTVLAVGAAQTRCLPQVPGAGGSACWTLYIIVPVVSLGTKLFHHFIQNRLFMWTSLVFLPNSSLPAAQQLSSSAALCNVQSRMSAER